MEASAFQFSQLAFSSGSKYLFLSLKERGKKYSENEIPGRGPMKRILVTSALPYINNLPHLGNIIGSHLPADVFARFCRLKGFDVVFIGGTDENGSPTEVAAFRIGKSPKEFCDEFYEKHKKIYEWFGISYDCFSRTSNKTNNETTKEIFLKIFKIGFISKRKILLPYCDNCKRYLPDRWIEGTCPYCGYIGARGDQCDKCTRLLDPENLKEPYCVICREKPEFKQVEHLFFDLDKLEPKLRKWIEKNKHWKPNVRNFALGWLDEGLKPRCITRNLEWGIHIPLKEFENLVFYCWFDAPIGYISSTKDWAIKTKKPDEWRKYWLNKDTKIYHFLGKDNIIFHTIIWPAIIIAHGRFNLPYQVCGLEYLNYEGDKFSKSRDHGIFIDFLDNDIKVRCGDKYLDFEPDIWRFYLISIMPETKDSDFKWKDFEDKINNELVANLGNFIFRTLSFIHKNFDSVVPKPMNFDKSDKEIIKEIEKTPERVEKAILDLRFKDSLKELMKLSDLGNKYFQIKKPWETIKTDTDKCKTTLYICANMVASLAVLIEPYLPFACEKLLKQLNLKRQKWDSAKQLLIKSGHKISKPEILFRKVEVS